VGSLPFSEVASSSRSHNNSSQRPIHGRRLHLVDLVDHWSSTMDLKLAHHGFEMSTGMSPVSSLLAAQQRWLDAHYPCEECPQCGDIVHPKRSRAGDKVYWGCFDHTFPVWCSPPVVLPREHLVILDVYKQQLQQAVEEAERLEARAKAAAEREIAQAMAAASAEKKDEPMQQLASQLGSLSLSPPSAAPSQQEPRDSVACRVCMDAEIDCILLPCRHLVICQHCSTRVGGLCPVCRTAIGQTLTIIRS
jgi:hypothetical protein